MSDSTNTCNETPKRVKLHEPRIRSGIGYFGEAAFQFWKDVINILAIIGEISEAVYYAVKNPRKIRWRETLYYMDVCGADALPILSLIHI